jgi:hypothetical protein
MRWALIPVVAAGLVAISSAGARAQMAFPSNTSVQDEVLVEVRNSTGRTAVDALLRRHRVVRLEAHRSQLGGTTVYRGRVRGHRSLAAVVRSLTAEVAVASAQPNHVFRRAQARPHKSSSRPRTLRDPTR